MFLLQEQRVRGNRLIRNLGRTGSDFSVGSDCLNAVKAGPCRNQLSKYAESSAVGLPGASNWTSLFCEGGAFSGKQKNYSPFTPDHV